MAIVPDPQAAVFGLIEVVANAGVPEHAGKVNSSAPTHGVFALISLSKSLVTPVPEAPVW